MSIVLTLLLRKSEIEKGQAAALYLRRRLRICIKPHTNGGGQERGIRGGIILIPLVVEMGAAHEESMLMLMGLKKMIIFYGSACTNANLEPSWMLRVLKVDENMTHMLPFWTINVNVFFKSLDDDILM
ncbi:hypothetical protein VNO77_01252 [Canavalia gladiata]|uniref:Uncharacterized protein n=1 Tax=Canavalia gladiata TaxID=3824 RepID=A0AAN9R637_CANGL